MTRVTTCPDAETVARRAASHVLAVLERARSKRGVAHVALSGGTTPGRTYELLGARREELRDVELWFADERCVGPEDEESNYLLVAQTLLADAPGPSGAADGSPQTPLVHRMEGERGPEEGATRYAQRLSERVAHTGGTTHTGGDTSAGQATGVPVLDLIVLGIGPDGHVASLFPGAPTLDAPADAVCLPVHDSPKPPPERITLSLAMLEAARGCLLLATGAGKADAVDAMLGEPTRHVPASLLRRERLTVIVDDAAAPDGPPRA